MVGSVCSSVIQSSNKKTNTLIVKMEYKKWGIWNVTCIGLPSIVTLAIVTGILLHLQMSDNSDNQVEIGGPIYQ